MYTIIIMVLCVLSVLIVTLNWKLYRKVSFLFWLLLSCGVGWVEFVCFLRYDAWVFAPQHVTGIKLLGVTIEDIFFCPCFSVIFYKLYYWTRGSLTQRIFNPADKLLFAVMCFGIALVYYDIGSQFSKYMALRTAIGLVGLVYCWNAISYRHSMLFIFVVYCIGFGWDLPSVAYGVWTYLPNGNVPQVYDGLYFITFGAKFPIEMLGYYFTGGFFSFWSISFFERYFAFSKTVPFKNSSYSQ